MKPYFIYTLPRTGSHLLIKMMIALDPVLRDAGEFFGSQYYFPDFISTTWMDLVERQIPLSGKEWEIDNIRRWKIIKESESNMLLKIHYAHLEFNPEILQDIQTIYTPICLIRRDVFSQALSHAIAMKTKVWTLWDKESAGEYRDSLLRNPIIVDEEVEQSIKWICNSRKKYLQQIENWADKEIIYFEDLISRPEEELQKLGYKISNPIQLPTPRMNPVDHLEVFSDPEQILEWYEKYFEVI